MADAQKAGPGFGSSFTSHMLVQHYKEGAWGASQILPYGSFTLPPSSVVFHYGQEIFEGFKAYQQPDGSTTLFRPERNLERLNNSARRLCMATVDTKQVLHDICKLIKADIQYLPA